LAKERKKERNSGKNYEKTDPVCKIGGKFSGLSPKKSCFCRKSKYAKNYACEFPGLPDLKRDRILFQSV
jgi:hypothetical protein